MKEGADLNPKEESMEDQEDLDLEDGEKEETAETEVSPDLEDIVPKIGGNKNPERITISVENNKFSSRKTRKM